MQRMKSHLRRLGALAAIVLVGMLGYVATVAAADPHDVGSGPRRHEGAILSGPSSGDNASISAKVADPDIQQLLNDHIHLSHDQTTIYWNLQSLSTIPRSSQADDDQRSMRGNSEPFSLDFDSLDLGSLVGVQVVKDINTVILTMKSNRKEDLVKVLDVIRTLDQPKKQVLIRVLVAEISTDKSQQVHNRIQMLAKSLGGKTDLSGQASIDQGIVPDTIEDRNTPGFHLYTVKDQALQSFLTMQKNDGQFEVLSNPHVVVKHGEKAKIMIGSKINMVSGETRVAGNDVQIAKYSDQDIGLEFIVTPYVYGNGDVGLDISQSMTELTLVGTDLKNVETNRRQIQTFASTTSGNTVVLGGMLQTRESRSIAGVPLLSRIPLVGKLFAEKRRQTKEVDLMLFITPVIIDGTQASAHADFRAEKSPAPSPKTARGR